MRITLLIDSLGSGGAQRQMANLAVELKRHGHQVCLIRYHLDDFYMPLLEKEDVELFFAVAKNPIVRALKIRKMIAVSKPQVVISFMDSPNFYASLASIGQKWRLIIGERICNPRRFTSRQGKVVKWIMAKFADVICCNSQSAADLWEKYHPEVKGKLSTIYNIVEQPNSSATRQTDGKIRFVVAARVEREKNLTGLIQAVASLSEAEKEVIEFHWYGRPQPGEDLLERSNEMIEEFSLKKQIIIHPPTDRIHDEMAKADFVSLFSFMEGLPNAILEGMALKKPIVMSKVSDYAVLVNEENGFLCEPDDPTDIAKALRCALSTTSEQRLEMGKRSYEKLQSVCSKDVIVCKWLELIES